MKTLILTAGLTVGFASAAQAYYITTPVNDPATDRIGLSAIANVNSKINISAATCPATVTPAGSCLTFTFLPNPALSGATSFVPFGAGTGAFSQWGSTFDLVKIKQMTVPFPMLPNITSPTGGGTSTTSDLPLANWVTLGDPNFSATNTTFSAENIPAFTFVNQGTGSLFNFETQGTWTTYTPTGVKTYQGSVSLGNTFDGLSTDQVIALATANGGFNTTYSGTGTLESKAVPEASAVLGVLFAAAAMFTVKRKIA